MFQVLSALESNDAVAVEVADRVLQSLLGLHVQQLHQGDGVYSIQATVRSPMRTVVHAAP